VLFSNPKTAELMTRHADRPEKSYGKLRHPYDARQWGTFDSNHKDFRDEKRNIQFVLSTNGMNPFGALHRLDSPQHGLAPLCHLPVATTSLAA
jgi:hypothetical protein